MMVFLKVILVVLILYLTLLGWKSAKVSEDLAMPECYKSVLAFDAVTAWIGAIILIIKLVRM